MSEMAPRHEKLPIDQTLVCARLCDAFRAVELDPPLPSALAAATGRLGDEAWRRFALEISCLDLDELRQVLPAVASESGADNLVVEGFVRPAEMHELLTLELLRSSPIRIEELSRSMLACMGVSVAGETEDESKQHLWRLDYARLLSEADRAKEAAEERSEELRKRMEEEYARNRPRGKW
jgi:hypothetical protein